MRPEERLRRLNRTHTRLTPFFFAKRYRTKKWGEWEGEVEGTRAGARPC